eukprot:symbB.v1.2.026305.t1/scaffold2617.1/size74789/2
MWPHEAQLELVGQHIARLTLADGLGFLAALLELHATPPGQVRLVELQCDAALDMDLTAMKDALVMLRMLPQVVLGLPPQQGRGLQVLLWAQCDVVLTTEEATFEVPKSIESMADFLPPDFQGWEHGNIDAAEAKDLGIVSDVVENKQQALRVIEQLCEQLSECAPNAVAQSKTFIHQIGSTPMRPDVLRQLAEHIAKRTEDPEFPDSIRALWEKAHVPIYRRPGHRVVPAHLIEEEYPSKPGSDIVCIIYQNPYAHHHTDVLEKHPRRYLSLYAIHRFATSNSLDMEDTQSREFGFLVLPCCSWD